MTSLQERVERFLFEEAHLLDERRFEDWQKLLAPDMRYLAPVSSAAEHEHAALALYDERLGEIELRLRRMAEMSAYTERPPRHACRMLANVVLESQSPDLVRTRCKMALHDYRVSEFARDEARLFAATVRHALRPQGDTFVIVEKRIDLIASEAALPVLTAPI
jgi:3-phenylpropionate/cinnamic acid dioxygenase small subunit